MKLMNNIFRVYTTIVSIIFSFVYTVQSTNPSSISPFTSLKFDWGNIIVTLEPDRKVWHRLLSVNKIGTDAIINFARQRYGSQNCDQQIPCFKYHIIEDFPKVFMEFQNEPILTKVELEVFDNGEKKVTTDATPEKMEIYRKNFKDNVKLSKVMRRPIFSSLVHNFRYL